MEVRVPETANGRLCVVEVDGDVDMATADDLERCLNQAIDGGRGPVVIDLTDCPFIDSSGIRILLRAHRRVQNNDGCRGPSMAVIARHHVAGLLQMTAVDKVFPVVGSRAEADGLVAGSAG